MTVFRLQSVFVVALVAAGVLDTAQAQDLPLVTRGSVKVRSRVFNPFDIGQSRLTIDPFGALTFTDPAQFAVAPTSSSAPATSSTTSTAVPATGGTVGGGLDGGFASGAAVRPPFRPPERSPWRPPPRPPFFPP